MLNYRNQLFHDIDASALPKIDKLELKINIIVKITSDNDKYFNSLFSLVALVLYRI